MVEEATAASHALTGEAGELATIVSRFGVDGKRHVADRERPDFARAS